MTPKQAQAMFDAIDDARLAQQERTGRINRTKPYDVAVDVALRHQATINELTDLVAYWSHSPTGQAASRDSILDALSELIHLGPMAKSYCQHREEQP